eukprot:TRINITY_DN4512_c0_g3_i1.p1 TRINITY_DN4512_c0_g3~~TRINITY_DN4512_c0_g3_i1.p1  ORF type:complete len:277 (+),score=79.37 TRINITY_DN4512_c0_g3_i1:54-884(+)
MPLDTQPRKRKGRTRFDDSVTSPAQRPLDALADRSYDEDGNEVPPAVARRPSVIARKRFSESVLWWIDMVGTVLFAAAGCLGAGEQGLDFIGCLVIGAVCGVGGGTVRDIMFIDRSHAGPAVFWVREPIYLEVAIVASVAAFCAQVYMEEHAKAVYAHALWEDAVFWLDSIGLGCCACMGVDEAVKHRLRYIPMLVVAFLSSVGGGVLRDVLCQTPVRVMRADKEMYAPAPILAGMVYYALLGRMPIGRRTICAVAACVGLRYYAVSTGSRLPTLA